MGSRPFGSTFVGSFQVFCCSHQMFRMSALSNALIFCALFVTGGAQDCILLRLQRAWMLHWPPTSVTQLSLWLPRVLLKLGVHRRDSKSRQRGFDGCAQSAGPGHDPDQAAANLSNLGQAAARLERELQTLGFVV